MNLLLKLHVAIVAVIVLWILVAPAYDLPDSTGRIFTLLLSGPSLIGNIATPFIQAPVRTIDEVMLPPPFALNCVWLC